MYIELILSLFVCIVLLGGLVHRNTGGTTTTGSSSSRSDDGGASYNPPGAEGGVDVPENYEDDGGDSKAVRLTLMEEVLLLGLKDREVHICVYVCVPCSLYHEDLFGKRIYLCVCIQKT